VHVDVDVFVDRVVMLC